MAKKRSNDSDHRAPRRRAPALLENPPYARPATFFGRRRYDGLTRVPEVDVLLCGLPFDAGALIRPGARFGPQAVREASKDFGSYSDALGIDVNEELQIADGGDLTPQSQSLDEALTAIADRVEAIARSGVIGGFIGGDQTVTLGALRGIHRAKLRSVGFVHFDAGTDALTEGKGRPIHQHSVVHVAVEEGLLEPDAVIQVGIRGPHHAHSEMAHAFGKGFEIIKVDDVKWDLHAAVTQLRKVPREGGVYVSVDISVLDPAYAPGTASPRPGGLNTWELQQLLRALVGTNIVGFDVVEVAPPYDSHGKTAQAAASALHELLAVLADTRRSGRAAPSRSSRRRGQRMSP